MLAPEGYGILATVGIIAVVLIALSLLVSPFIRIPIIVLCVVAILFTIYFFRDPHRVIPADPGNILLSPADGKVIEIAAEYEPLYLKSDAVRLSIFLSPLNVHVNRIPARGTVEYVNYVPGDYLVAWHEKASELNERSEIGLAHPNGQRVLFKQIAGAIARRIVYHVEEGDQVAAGDRFGVVKFGSRMDVLVPLTTTIDVEVGDVVRGGITILGSLEQVSETVSSGSLTDRPVSP